jgi:hypothetical protein
LSSAGFKANVWGDHSAHLYGDLTTGGCAVAICYDQKQEVEAFLNAGFSEDELHFGPEEISPTDANPPGIFDLFYLGIWLSIIFAALLTPIQIMLGTWSDLVSNLFWLPALIMMRFALNLIAFLFYSLIFAILVGFSLQFFRGLKNGSPLCRGVMILIAALLSILVLFCPV